MNKPNNYDNTSAGGFTPVETGGHSCIIKEVVETKSKNGAPMIRVNLDFDNADRQPKYFTILFADDIRPDKKWPNNGGRYILSEDKDGNCSRAFKQFITCWEKSNGTTVEWGAGFARQFVNTKIGAVYGEVENEYNGKISMRREVRWWCPIDDAESADIPDPRYLNGSTPARQTASAAGTSDSNLFVPAGTDEEVPFQ